MYYSILKESLVIIAKWTHLFPCRTQKLSTFAPTIVRDSKNRSLPAPFYIHGGLAQPGEHLPYKQRVGGSIPSSSTII